MGKMGLKTFCNTVHRWRGFFLLCLEHHLTWISLCNGVAHLGLGRDSWEPETWVGSVNIGAEVKAISTYIHYSLLQLSRIDGWWMVSQIWWISNGSLSFLPIHITPGLVSLVKFHSHHSNEGSTWNIQYKSFMGSMRGLSNTRENCPFRKNNPSRLQAAIWGL